MTAHSRNQLILLFCLLSTFQAWGQEPYLNEFTAARPVLEKAIANPNMLKIFLTYTQDGWVFHGTNVVRAMEIVDGDFFIHSVPAYDNGGLYTIGRYFRSMEYAKNKQHDQTPEYTPVVLEYQVDVDSKPRVLLLDEHTIANPEVKLLMSHFKHKRDFWLYLSKNLSLDATVDGLYPTFYSSRILKGPRSISDLRLMLERRKEMSEVLTNSIWGPLSSKEMAGNAIQAIDYSGGKVVRTFPYHVHFFEFA